MSTASGLPVRVLLGVGDRELERRLVRDLTVAGMSVAGRSLDGPSLAERALEPGVDVILAAADLHRLTETTLALLRERRVPVVLLAADGTATAELSALASVLPASAPSEIILAAVSQAHARGTRPLADDASGAPTATTEGVATGRVIAVASGKGAPGKTTIAIALTATLAASGLRVALVDADLRGGNVAPYLDLDPRRGLVGLLAAGGQLEPRLNEELQAGPDFAVLAGIERPELAAGLQDDLLASAVTALAGGFDRVVVDLGVPADPALLRVAHEVLVVTGADLVSIWNARTGLRAIAESSGSAAVSAVVNRREGREHYDRAEVERALGIPVLGVVREDRKAARRAVAKQLPLSEAGGRAARDLRALTRALEHERARADSPSREAARALVSER